MHNAPMPRLLTPFLLILSLAFSLPAHAWNAAGHRIVAAIAWRQLDPPTRDWVSRHLAAHPDAGRRQERARSNDAEAIFCEAATWPDDIRSDPRYYDESRDTPTPPIAGLPDQARHKDWHYVDLDPQGRPVAGQIDRRLAELERLLRSTADVRQISWALPWLLHLVGDIHQPLHVGRHGDEGGNTVEIENPANPRLPFTNLHAYWDDLPGAPWLRGKRLAGKVEGLLERHTPPSRTGIGGWRDASHRLLAEAYPRTAGSLLPVADEGFRERSREIAEGQLVAAGYRLGWMLKAIAHERVPRETP